MRCSTCGHCVAICPQDAIEGYDTTDTRTYQPAAFDIEPERLLNFIKFRRSVRKFSSQPISESDLAMLIDAGRFTPTGGNRQDVAYIVVQEAIPQLKTAVINSLKHLADNAEKSNNVYARGYAKMWQRIYAEYTNDPTVPDEIFFGAPLIIFVVAKEIINGTIASHSIEMMANSLGLGACYIGAAQYVANYAEVARVLDIPERYHAAACLAIGHPAVKYYRTVARKPAKVVRK